MVALRYNNEFVEQISGGQLGGVLLNQTCFYAEQGGQMYDNGFISKIGDVVSHFFPGGVWGGCGVM